MWKPIALVLGSYLLVALLGVLFVEGLLGGCDIGKCLFLTVR